MSRSSTSSSDGWLAERRALIQFRPRLFSTGLLAIVVMLAAAEGALRLGAVRDQLPIRTHFHEPGVVVRLQTLEDLQRQVGGVDVLFIGSSIVRCNIRPLLFDEILAERGVGHPVSFNAGMSGLWPQTVDLYAEQLWVPRAHPRVVIQGIRFGELLPSRRARRYDAILMSPIEGAWQERGAWGRLRAAAFERIHLLQYRGVWPMWLERWANGRSVVEDDELRVFTDARGWTPRLPTLDVVRSRNLLEGETPNPLLERTPDVDRALDAIRRTARATRRVGAAYVLVNVPEHAFRWSGADGAQRYARYLALLRDLARSEGFPFVDVSDGDPMRFSNDREYSDYHHMSPDGAAHFTTLLATRLDGGIVTSAMRAGVTTAARRDPIAKRP